MSTSQHTPSRVDDAESLAPVTAEHDGGASRRTNRLGLYCALAGAPLFAAAVLLRGAGQVALVLGILAGVLFVVAVCLNLPGIDTDAMMSDRPQDVPRDPIPR